jgi:hypothetical protein
MDLMARSIATQAMTFEWVKCRLGPRTSQIPSSGSRQPDSRKSIKDDWNCHADSSEELAGWHDSKRADMSSPYTSSWNWPAAALPMRTGDEFS